MWREQAKTVVPSSRTPPYSGGLFSMFHWMSTFFFFLGEAVINTVNIKTATVHGAHALQCVKCLFEIILWNPVILCGSRRLRGGLSVASELRTSFSILSEENGFSSLRLRSHGTPGFQLVIVFCK